MDRKKELKQQYLQMKPDMGILVIRSKNSNKVFLDATQDLKSRLNRIRFQLAGGAHPNKGLQKEWKELGEANFTIEVLEKLEYDKDESKTDYTEDLALLLLIWDERLGKEGMELY